MEFTWWLHGIYMGGLGSEAITLSKGVSRRLLLQTAKKHQIGSLISDQRHNQQFHLIFKEQTWFASGGTFWAQEATQNLTYIHSDQPHFLCLFPYYVNIREYVC